jgi:integrase
MSGGCGSRRSRRAGRCRPTKSAGLFEQWGEDLGEFVDFSLAARFAILTGLRLGEHLGLQWEDFDGDRSVVRVRRSLVWRRGGEYLLQTPKSEKSVREVDIGPALKTALQELRLRQGRPSKGFVFCTTDGRPLVGRTLRKAFRRACRRAKIEGRIRWHDLRHTFGSLKLAQGEDIVYVSRQLGHSNVGITANVYSHVIRARRPEAAAATEARIGFGP